MHAGPTLPEPTPESIVRAGASHDEASLELIRDALVAPAARLRVLALRAARQRDALAQAEWARALSDSDPAVRREALVLLARGAWSPALGDLVLSALGDEDPLVVDAAAFALGEHPDARFVPGLLNSAHHEDPRCREAVVAALGAIGDERALPSIIAALGDKAPVRRRAVVALANFEGPEVDEALARALQDRDWQVRAAAEQLGN